MPALRTLARAGVRPVVLALAVALLTPAARGQEPEVFPPIDRETFRVVNSVAFSPSGEEIFFAVLYGPYLESRGRPDDSAPSTAMFSVRQTETGWAEPELLSFSGRFQDYEPTLSADGRLMVFNSKRPYADGRIPGRNDLYVTELGEDGAWSEPARIETITTFEYEESYASLSDDGSLVFMRARPDAEGATRHDLFSSRLVDGEFRSPERHPVSTDRWSEGDPWLARDGSYLIFTRWDEAAGWEETVDLYIAFSEGTSWSEPVPLEELNSDGPDFGAAVTPDGSWLHYRRDYRFQRVFLPDVLERHGPGAAVP